MRLVKDMYVYCFVLLVQAAGGVDIQMTGELGFDLRVSGLRSERARDGGSQDSLLLMLNSRSRAGEKTCKYQYPRKKQVNLLLSNMMNELTKIFVRAREYLKSLDATSDWRARSPLSRFRVVSDKSATFFDGIYANMTEEYKTLYYRTFNKHHLRMTPDPCEHQDEIKQMWVELLDSSLEKVREAAIRCVNKCLKEHGRIRDSKSKNKLGQFLLREFGKLRSYQLDTLCSKFELCYSELL